MAKKELAINPSRPTLAIIPARPPQTILLVKSDTPPAASADAASASLGVALVDMVVTNASQRWNGSPYRLSTKADRRTEPAPQIESFQGTQCILIPSPLGVLKGMFEYLYLGSHKKYSSVTEGPVELGGDWPTTPRPEFPIPQRKT